MITIIDNIFVRIPKHKEVFLIHKDPDEFINTDGKIVNSTECIFLTYEEVYEELNKNPALLSLALEYDVVTEDDFDIMEFINYD
jgi:hypothetical protein